jgi:ATP-dependent helicase/nuclease subunit B
MQRINKAVSLGEGGQLFIVPEQYSHEAERELCRVCGDRMSLFAEVLSFTRLASRVADENGGSAVKKLDKGGKLLCMARALDAVGSSLSIYGAARKSPELQKSLMDALDELRGACIEPEALREAASRAEGTLGTKLGDLALIMEAYDAAAFRSGADPTDALQTLAETIVRLELGRGRKVYIDGFTDFTGQQKAVIRAMLKTGADITVCLTCDEALEGEMFEPSIKTVFALRRMAQDLNCDIKEEFISERESDKVHPLSHLEKNMFSFSDIDTVDAEGAVCVFRAENIAEECEAAAARAIWLAREKGARWRDIAVAVRGYDDYRPALESAFERYGVPLYSSRRGNILQKPLPTLIFSAFEIIQGGWSYDDVFTCLKTGLYGITRQECDALFAYVYTWNMRGSAWTSEKPWSLNPGGYGAKMDEQAQENLERINELRTRVAAPLKNLARRGKEAETALGQLEALSAFFDEIALAENLENRARELKQLGRDTLAAEYVQLWDIIVGAMEQCAEVLGDVSMGQEEFSRLFKIVLSQYDVGTIPVSLDIVTAGDMDRMRRRHIKHLIVLGATEERLPSAGGEGGIFSDDERERLLQLGLETQNTSSDIYREFMLIYNCLTLPSDSLMLTYPMSGSSGETSPSFVVRTVCRMFALDAVRVEPDRLRTNAARPALELAASGRGEYRKAAEEYFSQEDAPRLDALKSAARLTRGTLTSDSVRQLYGNRLYLTASRAEALSRCKYEYFLCYGLHARPRQQAGFEAPQMGSFMHFILEHVVRDIKALGGFAEVTREQVEEIAAKYVEEYVHRELNDFAGRTQRFIYLFRRLTATVQRVAVDMAEELRASDFEPIDFELNFSGSGDLRPIELEQDGEKVYITGIADRVDGWVHDGKLYLRVVDYKTGKKAFSLSDVCSGMGLQMLMYLFALGEEGQQRYGKPIVPAGVLYEPARDVMVSASADLTDEELEKERQKKLRRSGLILDEEEVINAMEHGSSPRYIPVTFNKEGAAVGDSLASAEKLGALSRFVEQTLGELASQLRHGVINADPYYKSAQDNSCLYCDYADVCHFGEDGEQPHYIASLRAPEAWDYIEKKTEGGAENG